PDGYYEGYYSLLDGSPAIRFSRYDHEPHWLAGLDTQWAVQRLQWFTKGFYAVSRRGDAVLVTDLRMGQEPAYVFRFKVGEVGNPHPKATPAVRVPTPRDYHRLPWLWQRIWTPTEPAAAPR